MRILLVGYDPYEHGEEEFEELFKEEIEALDGDVWTREYDLTNPTFHQVECLVSDVQSWTEKGGLMYVKEVKKGDDTIESKVHELSDKLCNAIDEMQKRKTDNAVIVQSTKSYLAGLYDGLDLAEEVRGDELSVANDLLAELSDVKTLH